MEIKLTDRMKAWIKTVCFLNVADKKGVPHVTIARNIDSVSDDEVIFALSQDEYSVIEEALAENAWVSFGAGGVGSIRFCYQFKGKGTVEEKANLIHLKVKLVELYCTKPGCYAGMRLDTKSPEELAEWEECLWKDMPKSR